MRVFATNWFETMTDDVDGGNDWSWTPNRPAMTSPSGYDGTGPGAPTGTQTTTRSGQDQTTDTDTATENMGGGLQVA